MKTEKVALILILILLFSIFMGFYGNISELVGYVTRFGQLGIGNYVPTVDYIYINGSNCTDNPADVIIDPTENTTTTVLVKARITDLNGDCDTFTGDNGTAYLCNGTGPCNANTADHTIIMNYDSGDGQWGPGNRYCNMTGQLEDVQFFEINGTWRVNVTVTDGINESDLPKNWTYGELRAFIYPPAGNTIYMGTLNLGEWNNGTAGDQMKNSGNIVLDLKWNASNFTGQAYGEQINLTGDNYIIDDDALSPDDTGNIPEVFINESSLVQVYFQPGTGLVRCSSVACDNANATFNLYWHILIPQVLKQDSYQNSIGVESEDH